MHRSQGWSRLFVWIRHCYNQVQVFLVLKIGMIHKFSYFMCFEEHFKQNSCSFSSVCSLFIYNQFHNILRIFDVLPNFSFTTSETMCDYYLQTWYIRVASRVAEQLKTWDLRKLGNIRKLSKLHRMIAQYPVSPPKWKFCQY